MMKAVLILAALLAGSFAKAETAVYKGDLNGTSVTLTIDALPTQLDSHFIACEHNDNPCDGPGTYAFFVRTGEATIQLGSQSGSVPLLLALYTGEETTVNGKLNGTFSFVDRTSKGNKVNGVTFYQDAQLQNRVQVAVTGLTTQAYMFPASYTVRWDNHGDEEHSGAFDSGSVVLVRQ